MSEHISKPQLLEKMRSGYAAFNALLSSLSETQLNTPDINDSWSIKDNIAHISAWQRRQIANNQAVHEGIDRPDPTPGMSIDEINEMYYQQNKNRALTDVLDEFHETARLLQESVEALTEEQLHSPVSWLDGGTLAPRVAGNSYEHYEEHSEIIERWLASQSTL
jgi:hypothetical protein